MQKVLLVREHKTNAYLKFQLDEKSANVEALEGQISIYTSKLSKLNKKLVQTAKRDEESYIEIILPSPLSMMWYRDNIY